MTVFGSEMLAFKISVIQINKTIKVCRFEYRYDLEEAVLKRYEFSNFLLIEKVTKRTRIEKMHQIVNQMITQ